MATAALVVGWGCGGDGTPTRPGRTADAVDDDHDAGDARGLDAVNGSDLGLPPDASPELVEGAALYATHCALCHGPDAGGGVGPALRTLTTARADLVDRIATTMPPAAEDACAGTCAERVADYLIALRPPDVTVDCDGPAVGPRQLRLLTPREYAATVSDLLGEARCTGGDGCDDGTFCVGDVCGCPVTQFEFDASGRSPRSVHVAGSFNGWAATVSAGGLAMRLDPASGRWRADAQLPPGEHRYKFVLDGAEWITDPAASRFEEDGFGGRNGIVDVRCMAADSPAGELVADFPAPVRPTGFPFESHAASGRVTPTHVAEQIEAAERVADRVVADMEASLGCDDGDRGDCERAFVETFLPRAFRRPISADERARYAALLAGAPDLDEAVRRGVQAALMSPAFLYRTELGAPSEGTHVLTSWEVASALSYGIVGTAPDAALREAAARDALQAPEAIAAEARRLLGDPRARDVVGTFAVQWLGVEAVESATRSPDYADEFADAVRRSALDETRRFVAHVVFDATGAYDELLRADYTVGAAPLSALYGFDRPLDGAPATYTDGRRAGFLGHASVLATYAHSDQTSPIRRGLFVRQRLLCQSFPEPPANAGGVPEVDPTATTRERFRQHTDDAFCFSCHRYIDDVGFGFEAFDPIGRFRTEDGSHPVDALGNMNDVEGLGTGTSAPWTSLPELADILADSRAAHLCFVEQVLRFLRGRTIDACEVESAYDAFAASGFDIQALIVAAFTAPEFLHRESP